MSILLFLLGLLFMAMVVFTTVICGIAALSRRSSNTQSRQRVGQGAFDVTLRTLSRVTGALEPNMTPELSLTALEKVQDLLRQRRKIDAIKLYKEQTGVGLKEAKDAVDELERGWAGQFAPVAQTLRSAADAHEDILALVREGQKIQAIKLYREQTGVGLKAAKEVIDGVAQGAELPPFNSPAFNSPEMLHSQADRMVLWEEIRALLRQDKKIHAIKLYRDHTFSTLKDAKDAVEAIERTGL